MRIPHGAKNSGILTADTAVKSTEGVVLAVVIAFKGVTAGEFCTIQDGDSDILMAIFDDTDGTIMLNLGFYGVYFMNGIKFNKGATAGSVFATVIYE